MPEPTSPPIAEAVDRGDASAGQNHVIEAILGDFRAWLTQQSDLAVEPSAEPSTELNWATLVGQFTALRHEVNLQTRASRQQQEQSAQALEQLRLALDAVTQQQANSQQEDRLAQDESQRPLLKTLLDVHDALSLARREVQRIADSEPSPRKSAPIAVPAVEAKREPPPTVTIKLPFWARFFGGAAAVERGLAPLLAWQAAHQPTETVPPNRSDPIDGEDDDASNGLRRKVDALLVGYDMSLQRLDRALQQHGLEPIVCVGALFDPELMEVAEVVRDPSRQQTEVLDEVRRGYRWRGRLFRYAQVRVARPA